MKRKYSNKKLKLFKLVLGLLGLVLIFAIYSINQYQIKLHTPVDKNSNKEVILTINKGDQTWEIANELNKNDLIQDEMTFKIYTRLNNIDKNIKTGRFALNKSMTIPEIVDVITSDNQKELIVTIPEGSTVYEIDQILSDQGLIEKNEFINAVNEFDNYEQYEFLNSNKKELIHPLEGYLFPDTYYVDANNFQNEALINKMLNNFEIKIADLESARDLEEIIIVASMIEEEANQNKDRPLISGIIWKRLDENWLLGIDATLLYLAEDRQITYQDLQEDSPYNTRKKLGLPPGPITNPGFASIEAAYYPEESEYYYYLTSKDGEMIYSKTDDEHNFNKRKYL
ncbi:endolytic transglycosylase MltG [Candidatus Peregrinibacteria bacterium]|nr:endolytic transglycosylase MltG [Candidatus Peregrinibacteria bacterium]